MATGADVASLGLPACGAFGMGDRDRDLQVNARSATCEGCESSGSYRVRAANEYLPGLWTP